MSLEVIIEKKKNLTYTASLILFLLGLLFILSVITGTFGNERIHFAVDIGMVSYLIFECFWFLVYTLLFSYKYSIQKGFLRTILIGMIGFISGFLLEFFWMYDNITF